MMPDLDLQKGELESPDKEADTDSLDPFPSKPQTGSRRRPTIDTASLIPSLLQDPKDTEEKETDKLPLEAFLRDADGESIQIDTKELETLTSADGTELSISRGVQELLKIVDNNPDREWREDELQLVDQVHTQLELALENANLFQQTQIALAETDERARQLRLLNQMSEEINQTDDLLEIYGIVTDKTIQIFGGQRVSITILTGDRTELEVVAATGDTSPMPIGTRFPLEDTSNEIVVRENRVFIPPGKRTLNLGEVQSTMIGPITVSNNVIGTLNVGSTYQNAFNDRDANFLTQLLSILNASVENRKLFEQIETALSTTEEQARRLAILNRLSEKLTLTETFEQVIGLILDHVNQILPADEWAYTHVNEEMNTYELFIAPDKLEDLPTMDGSPISMTQPLENSIVGKAAKDRRTIIEFNCLESAFDDVRLWAGDRGVRTAMSSPILVGNQVIGVLNIGSKQQSAYTVQEENIMLSITSLAGSTIDNRQLLGQIQKRSVQLETSAEVSRVASTMLDPSELLPRAVELIKDGFDLYYAGIFLIDETGEFTGEPGKWAVLRAGSGEAGQQMIGTGHKLEIGGESMIGTAISTAQARIALSVGEEEHFFRNPFLPNTRSEMALPLTSRGEVLGALSIQSEVEDAFKQEDITALQTMADQLANTIENARLFEQTEMRAEELTVLNEMARGFTQTMDVDELIENTFQFTGRLMEASNFYMVLYYPDEQFYEFKLFVEEGQKMPPPRTRVKLGEGLTDWIITNKLPVLIPADSETHLMALGVEPRDKMPKSWLGVPMLLGNEVTGVIAVQSYTKPNTYNSHSLDLLIAVSSQAAVAIDNARRFQATQTRARHEEILRRVTTQVHSTSDPEAILRTAVREVSDALGKPAFVKLNPQERSVGITTEKPEQIEQDTIPPLTPPDPGDPEER
jgi:GAF domain-containing protein